MNGKRKYQCFCRVYYDIPSAFHVRKLKKTCISQPAGRFLFKKVCFFMAEVQNIYVTQKNEISL